MTWYFCKWITLHLTIKIPILFKKCFAFILSCIFKIVLNTFLSLISCHSPNWPFKDNYFGVIWIKSFKGSKNCISNCQTWIREKTENEEHSGPGIIHEPGQKSWVEGSEIFFGGGGVKKKLKIVLPICESLERSPKFSEKGIF